MKLTRCAVSSPICEVRGAAKDACVTRMFFSVAKLVNVLDKADPAAANRRSK
jgi:hypothetical protein